MFVQSHENADVAELADALVSGSSEAIHVGSSPFICTKQEKSEPKGSVFFCFLTNYISNPTTFAPQTFFCVRKLKTPSNARAKVVRLSLHFSFYCKNLPTRFIMAILCSIML